MTDENVVHVYPEGSEPEHKMDGFCWCQPLVEDVPPNGRVYIHRRTIDSAHIEEDEGQGAVRSAVSGDQSASIGPAGPT